MSVAGVLALTGIRLTVPGALSGIRRGVRARSGRAPPREQALMFRTGAHSWIARPVAPQDLPRRIES